jgi:hypothetical protein
MVKKKQTAIKLTLAINPLVIKTEKRSGDFSFTPGLPEPNTLAKRLGKKTETITLVPYGCTNLRVTIFPRV